MREQTVFFADDDTLCESREEALARDKVLEQKGIIAEWMELKGYNGKKVPEYERILTDFLVFLASRK